MDTVYAFHPRRSEPPYFVAEDADELRDRVGDFVPGPQCDGCGNSSYRVVTAGHGSPEPIRGYSAQCAVDPTDDPEFTHPDPCGTVYTVGVHRAEEVVF